MYVCVGSPSVALDEEAFVIALIEYRTCVPVQGRFHAEYDCDNTVY